MRETERDTEGERLNKWKERAREMNTKALDSKPWPPKTPKP